jgi:hypothetical protein
MAQQRSKNACYVSNTISKKTVIASFQEGSRTRQWLESLRDEQWYITTFIPEAKLVCANVVSPSGTITHIALTLPTISTSSLT